MSEEKNKKAKNSEENSNQIYVNKNSDKRKKSNGGYDHPPQSDQGYKED